MEFGAHDAVAVFAGMRALVVAHHGKGFLRYRPHGGDVAFQPDIEHRPDMQAADGGMGVPGAAGAVFGEDGGQPVGVVGKIVKRHGAVFDEGHRLAGLLHRHHDVETGGAKLRDRRLQPGVTDRHDAALMAAAAAEAETEIAHRIGERRHAAGILVRLLGEFHK